MSAAAGDVRRGPLLAFLNEVAGGRRLLEAVRERAPESDYVAVVAPANQPAAGQLVATEELDEAARSRVEVTLEVLAEFGIDGVGEVLDRDPSLALGDAIRAHRPREVLLSCLYDSRFGLMRKDLVEWAQIELGGETEITHIPVRLDDDAVRWDVNHTLVVATRTVASPDLLRRLTERAAEHSHRYTLVCPRSEGVEREEVCADLASTLAALYREGIDATGQPMSPEPFAAAKNAIAHYRVDDILISTFAGEESAWLKQDLIGRVREITDKPVEHIEVGRTAESVAATVAGGTDAG